MFSSMIFKCLNFECVGLSNLETVNLSFTQISDGGLKKLSGLTALKSLNVDTKFVTDIGLVALTCKFLLIFTIVQNFGQ